MTQKSAAKERSAAAAVGLREGAFLGGIFLFVKKFLCVAIGDSFFVHFYLDLSTPRSSSNKNESFLRFPRDAILSLVVCK